MKKLKKYFYLLFKSIYFFLITFTQKNKFLVDKRVFLKDFEKEKENIFCIFIELGNHPVNFNYVEYLLNGKVLSKSRKVYLVILPEFDIKKNYSKNTFSQFSNMLRSETILYPIISVIKDFNPSIFICKNRSDANDFFNLSEDKKFPQDAEYEKINYKSFYVNDLYKNIISYKYRPLIAAPVHKKDILNNVFLKKNQKEIITISIRYTFDAQKKGNDNYDIFRNSNIDVWLDVCDWIKNNTDYLPVIIPDLELLAEKDSFFRNHEIFNLATYDLALRTALYEVSFLNLLVPSGFAELLIHSQNNFKIFKFGDERIKNGLPNSIEENMKTYDVRKNEQLKFCSDNQKIYWGSDSENYNFIISEIQKFIKTNKK